MKVLINYNPADVEFLPMLTNLMREIGAYGFSTHKTYELGQLLVQAHTLGCDAILLANEKTLANCVQSEDDEPTLSTWRGSRLNFSIPAIVLSPLKHLKTLPYGKFVMRQDVHKLKYIKTKPIQFNFTLVDRAGHFAEVERDLQKAVIISADIETDLYNRITCISFAALFSDFKTRTYVIPFWDYEVCHYQNPETYERALLCMKNVLENKVPKAFFNGLYDVQLLLGFRIWVENWVLDPMALTFCEYSELPKDLAFVASLYLYDYYYWKEDRTTSDLKQFWLYNARDSWNTLRVLLYQFAKAEPYTFANYKEQFRYVFPSLYCAFEGFAVDTTIQAGMRLEVEAERAKALQNLRIMTANPEFNPNSSKQTAEFLYDILGAKTKKDYKGNAIRSTEENVLKWVATQHPILDRVIQEIWVFREKEKLITTYFNAELLNGRLLYSLSPFATETGRMASKKSNWRLWGLDSKGKRVKKSYGAQVQNIPAVVKKYLVADDGFVIIEPDNNKSEARCVSYLSECEKMKAALEDRSKDFYKILGTLFFGLTYEKVTAELRNKVLKRVVHGSNYMMQEDTFIDTVGSQQLLEGARLLNAQIGPALEYNEEKRTFPSLKHFAKYLLELYHKPFPEIRTWYKKIKNTIALTNKLVSPLGWTRWFFGDPEVPAVLRAAVAHQPQNLSVAILNRGWWKIYTQLVVPSNGEVRLKAQVHDSAPCQILEAKKDYYAEEIRKLLVSTVIVKGKPMTIPVDYKTGRSWYDAKG